jgi:dolichol kinase
LALVLLGVPFAIFGLFAISIGDAAATLVGKYVGRHKLLWNKEKSIEGWIGFFAATALSLFIFLQFMPQFAIFNPLWLAIAVGITGATIETIPIVNDNTIIPLGTGLVLWLLSLLL